MEKKKQQRKRRPKKPAAKLVEALEFYLKLEPPPKNKGGRPKRYHEGLSPEDVVGLPHFFKNPRIGEEFFWSVFSMAETPKGAERLNKKLAQWEEAISGTEKAAAQLKDATILSAEQKFKQAEEHAASARREVAQLRDLVKAIECELPRVKSTYILRMLAKFFASQKAKNRHWQRDFQKTMPKEYQKLKFLHAVKDWLFDKYGKEYSANTIREEIRLAASSTKTGSSARPKKAG